MNGNAQKLTSLGLSVDNTGFISAEGVNFTLANGSANIDGVMGLNTFVGSSSSDGVLAAPGDRLFIDSSNKQDILTTLSRFSETMKSFDGSNEFRDQVESMVASTLDNLSATQTKILDVMSKIGARFNTLESTRALHLDTEMVTQEVLSELRDIDYAEAATRLSVQSMVLQAAQSSFIRVSQLTLFSHL